MEVGVRSVKVVELATDGAATTCASAEFEAWALGARTQLVVRGRGVRIRQVQSDLPNDCGVGWAYLSECSIEVDLLEFVKFAHTSARSCSP